MADEQIFESNTATELTAIKYIDGNSAAADIKVLQIKLNPASETATAIWHKPLKLTINATYNWENGDEYKGYNESITYPTSAVYYLPYGTTISFVREQILSTSGRCASYATKPYYGSENVYSYSLTFDYGTIANECVINKNPALKKMFPDSYQVQFDGATDITGLSLISAADSAKAISYLDSISGISSGITTLTTDLTISLVYKIRYREYKTGIINDYWKTLSNPAEFQEKLICYDPDCERAAATLTFTAINPTATSNLAATHNNSVKCTYTKATHSTKSSSALKGTFYNNVPTINGNDPYFGSYVVENTMLSSWYYNASQDCWLWLLKQNSDFTIRKYTVSFTADSGLTWATSSVANVDASAHIGYNNAKVPEAGAGAGFENTLTRNAQPNRFAWSSYSISSTNGTDYQSWDFATVATNYYSLGDLQSYGSTITIRANSSLASDWKQITSTITCSYYTMSKTEISIFSGSSNRSGLIKVHSNSYVNPAPTYCYLEINDGMISSSMRASYTGYLTQGWSGEYLKRKSGNTAYGQIGLYMEVMNSDILLWYEMLEYAQSDLITASPKVVTMYYYRP